VNNLVNGSSFGDISGIVHTKNLIIKRCIEREFL
jgi:hypothetical protein